MGRKGWLELDDAGWMVQQRFGIARRLLDRRPKVRMPKVVAFVENRLALVAGQRIAEAVPEVQIGRVSASAPVVAIGLASNLCLFYRDGLYLNVEPFDNLIHFPAQRRRSPAVHYDGHFEISDRRNTQALSPVQDFGKGDAFGLEFEDRDKRRSVDDHRGNPDSLSNRRSPILSEGGKSLSRGAVCSDSFSNHSRRPSFFSSRCCLSRRSFSATVTATVRDSPVRFANSRARRSVSAFLIFIAIGFHLSTIGFYHSTIGKGMLGSSRAQTSRLRSANAGCPKLEI